MTYAVIATKLYLPQPGPTLVSRKRLMERLSPRAGQRLILVCAPAGFGKTTLLTDWLNPSNNSLGNGESGTRSRRRRVCWLSLDERDNDPIRFWTYFLAALQKVEPEVGRTSAAHLQSSLPFEAIQDEFLADLLNELDGIRQETLLILEDYHVIDTASIHLALSYMVDYLPPSFRLILTSRTDPPLPLARWRARGALNEIRADDLRFTSQEAEQYLNQVLGLGLPPEAVKQLESQTEGWIAGLHLAALTQPGQAGVCLPLPDLGNHRYIMDYLVEEVLERQPQFIQQFLLYTAFLERMTPSLCAAVTGQSDSPEILHALKQINLFLVALDDEGNWYRYHHLFAEALRLRLTQTVSRPVLTQLYLQASLWFEEQGLIDEAVRYALKVSDQERAVSLMERYGEEMLQRGEMLILRGWVDTTPETWVSTRPWLTLLFAWALLLSNRIEAAERALNRVAPLLEEPVGKEFAGEILSLQAFVARNRGDWGRSDELACVALEQIPLERVNLRAATCLVQGDAFVENERAQQAIQAYQKSAQLGEECGHLYIALASLHRLGGLYLRLGHLVQAREVFEKALHLSTASDGTPLKAAALAYVGMGEVLREQNQLEQAAQYLERGLDLLQGLYETKALLHASYSYARALQALGREPCAQDALLRGLELLERKNAPEGILRWMHLYRLDLDLRQGHLPSREIEDELAESRLDAEPLVFARLSLLCGVLQDERSLVWKAVRLLEKQSQGLEQNGWQGEYLEALVLLALAWQALGRQESAGQCLERALCLSEPQGYVRLFLDEGPAMEGLLRSHIPASAYRRTIKRLLEAFRSQPRRDFSPRPASRPPLSGHDLPRPLTRQEAEVLHRLAEGLSNQEIAADFGLSESTILTHIKHIYRKLEVHTRTQAVARAHKLGILAQGVGTSGG